VLPIGRCCRFAARCGIFRYTAGISAARAQAAARYDGATGCLITDGSIPARPDLQPGEPKSFCMSMTNTAARSKSRASGAGRAGTDIIRLDASTLGVPVIETIRCQARNRT
jgi:hypothetical protein